MLQIATAAPKISIEHFYDTYSASLYGLIIKISKSTQQAEEILIESFKSFAVDNSISANQKFTFMNLLKLTIPIAAEKTNLSKKNIGQIILKEMRVGRYRQVSL